jgi:DNA polymerase-3 subunit epsilon
VGNSFQNHKDRYVDVNSVKNIIVFDLETNGLESTASVLSCAAIKYAYQSPRNTHLREIDRFNRYYFSREPENPQAIRINGLTADVITEKRKNKSWPRYFTEDTAFETFCADADLFVAHNINFDSQFVPFIKKRKAFCTMTSNVKYFGKYPKLGELAVFFGITPEGQKLHSSEYDAELTAKILQHMIDENEDEIFILR